MKYRNIITIVCIYMYPFEVLSIPDVKMPSIVPMVDMKVSWVAEKYFYNGYPMTIQEFHSPQQFEKILKHYERQWGIKRSGSRLSIKSNGEYSLGYQENNYSYTMLVSNFNNSSQGYFIVSENKYYKFKNSTIPVQVGDALIARSHSIDGVKMTETLIIESSYSYNINNLLYRKMIEKDGWKLVESEADKTKRVELLKKDKSYCQINISKKLNDDKSIIVIHIMTENKQ